MPSPPYYRLSVDLVRMNTRIASFTNRWHSLTSGRPLDEGALKLPYRCEMLVDEELLDEVDSEEADDQPEPPEAPLFYSFYPSASVMHDELIEALVRAGVDGLQVFPAIVRCEALDLTFDDYSVVNILGLVTCADREHSTSSPLADLQFFHELALDERRAAGQRMFRLAESRIDVIVDAGIAEVLRAGPFVGLSLEPLASSNAS